ncbi:MAG: hypothetical protein ACI4W6_09435 [Acutalibacteraceae bacterium]
MNPNDSFYYTNKMSVTLEGMITQIDTFEEFEKRFSDDFLNDDCRIGDYLSMLMTKYNKRDCVVSGEAGLHNSYVGNIIRGIRNNPSRNAIIAICLAIGTTVEEVQYLLKYAGQAPLYVRRKRDVLIWFGFMKHYTVNEVDHELRNRNMQPLIKDA